MNQKTLVSVLAVLVLIFGGTTIYFLTAQKSVVPVVLTPVPVSKTVPAVQGSPVTPVVQDETVSWKTYTNDSHHFSVKYPNTWPVEDPTIADCNEDTVCQITIGNRPTTLGADMSSVIAILIHSPKILAKGQGDGFDPCYNFQKVTLASGLQAERKQCQGMEGTADLFSIDKNGTKYQVIHSMGSAEANSVFEKIANSFNFTK